MKLSALAVSVSASASVSVSVSMLGIKCEILLRDSSDEIVLSALPRTSYLRITSPKSALVFVALRLLLLLPLCLCLVPPCVYLPSSGAKC